MLDDSKRSGSLSRFGTMALRTSESHATMKNGQKMSMSPAPINEDDDILDLFQMPKENQEMRKSMPVLPRANNMKSMPNLPRAPNLL